MKLEKLLAENMLRFGVKNLDNSAIEKLMEQTAREYSLNQLPAELEKINYVPSAANYIAISDGNPWLAENRAINLKNFLVANIQKQVGIPFDAAAVKVAETAVSPNKGDQYQYVEGTIYGLMEKPPIPENKYRYQLAYKFYELNGKPYIVITKAGKGSPIKNASGTQVKQLQSQMPTTDSVLVKQGGLGSLAGEQDGFNYAILVPVPAGYVDKSAGRLYYKDANTMIKARDFIQGLEDGMATMPRNGLDANLVVADFTDTTGGTGNYIVGKAKSANVDIIAGPKELGNKGTVHRTSHEYGAGAGKGEPGTGTPGEWAKIGSFQLSKEDGAFLDNMITIQPGSYQQVFDSIKADIAVQKANNFKIVSLTATVKGYASADRATNRLPQGVTTPDHTYGGHVPAKYWIRK
jgi:hypothetical protein